MADNDTEIKKKPRAIMLTDDEYARIEKAASRYSMPYSTWGRMLMLQAAERDEEKGGK